jgi:hypothetical protein
MDFKNRDLQKYTSFFTTNAFYYSSDSQFSGGNTFSYYQEPSASGMPVRCIKE